MEIDYVQSELRGLDIERLGILMSAKYLSLAEENENHPLKPVVEDVVSMPALGALTSTLCHRFRGQYGEAIEDAGEVDDPALRELLTEEAMEYYSSVFNFGIYLSALAIKSLAETSETLGQDVETLERPDIIRDVLESIDYETAESTTQEFCDEQAFSESGSVDMDEVKEFCPAFAALPASIGGLAVNEFFNSRAYLIARTASEATFAAFIKVMGSAAESQRQQADPTDTVDDRRHSWINAYLDFLEEIQVLPQS